MFDPHDKSTGSQYTVKVALLIVAFIPQSCRTDRVTPIRVCIRFAGARLQCVVRRLRLG
jgi:hypothetical protein